MISTTGRSLTGLVLGCLLLAGCASAGGSPSPVAGEPSLSPKADPAAQTAAGPEAKLAHAAAVAAADPVILQRRRQTIARMLEDSIAYRTILDVKLIDAKIAGPLAYSMKGLFSSTWTEPITIYCVTAQLDIPWFHTFRRTSVIRVKKADDGSEVLRAATGINQEPSECSGTDRGYLPFPEMEQLRAARRQALGKSD